MNVFAKLDAYWDSDQSFLDEFQDCKTEQLLKLKAADEECLEALEREPDYWAWRERQTRYYTPRSKKPLNEVKRSTERHLRLVTHVLSCRTGKAC